ncbi:MAG: hypothetical protein Q8M07_10605 [Prosthecobacter sp.]|nr:hypothetical protein [Prosthecobacter sp.]
MTLYYHSSADVIAQILRHGFLVALGRDRAIRCCNRSLAGLGPLNMMPSMFGPRRAPVRVASAEVGFEVDADVSTYEVFALDMHPGRYFDIPVTVMERLNVQVLSIGKDGQGMPLTFCDKERMVFGEGGEPAPLWAGFQLRLVTQEQGSESS